MNLGWWLFLINPFLINAIDADAEPYCEVPCGLNADCIGSNMCKCREGYKDAISLDLGRPFCQPVCDITCIDHAACVAPNYCECEKGYTNNTEIEACEPICLSQCPYGRCIAPDQCKCEAGFVSIGSTCEPEILSTSQTTISFGTTYFEDEIISTEKSNEDQENIHDVLTKPVINSTNFDYHCPKAYIYVNGSCRPLINENCDPKICGPNTQCHDNGTCECLPGYTWKHQIGGLKNATDQCIRLERLTGSSKMSAVFYFALGSAFILFALLVLVFIFIKQFRN